MRARSSTDQSLASATAMNRIHHSPKEMVFFSLEKYGDFKVHVEMLRSLYFLSINTLGNCLQELTNWEDRLDFTRYAQLLFVS